MHGERRKLEVNKTFAEETYVCWVSAQGCIFRPTAGLRGRSRSVVMIVAVGCLNLVLDIPTLAAILEGDQVPGGTVIRIWLW